MGAWQNQFLEPEVIRALVIGIPAAVAVIVVVILFLRRMKDSQMLGHDVAKGLAKEHRDALRMVVDEHKDALHRFGEKIEKSANQQEKLADEVRELTMTIRIAQERQQSGSK